MNNKILNQNSCCDRSSKDDIGCCESSGSNCCVTEKRESCEKKTVCPICDDQGEHVRSITVKHLVKKEKMEDIIDENYLLCMNEDCEVAYFTETGAKFKTSDLKVPIWFKKGADPKYACYCNEITEEQVIETVVNAGTDNMKDVMTAIKGEVRSQCKVKNPLGKCCTQAFNEAIGKGLEIRNS
ncbi:(2Fe-2S)-binding protein [Methanococcoides sp.]|uniref:(2Fe-2S)-binding protein n=1 Tax=Methanococcoides sp. TaxID=1966350 RepID=UPI00272E8787|nr:(2Fe-2S)-binding protein [Methanococcoides sp.]